MLPILHMVLRNYLDQQISDVQILNIRQIIEQARKNNIALFICFVDYWNVCNVQWKHLWSILSNIGLPQHQALYELNIVDIRENDLETTEFSVEAGVQQDCILSSIVFNIVRYNFQHAFGLTAVYPFPLFPALSNAFHFIISFSFKSNRTASLNIFLGSFLFFV